MSRYKKIKVNGRTYQLHRYVMMCHIGRELRDDEIVHHINNVSHDNRIENLQILSAQEHSEHHNQKHPVERACDVCGVVYRPHPTKRARSRTCSAPCMSALQSRIAIEHAADPEIHAKRVAAAFRNGSAERGKTLVMHRWHPDAVPPTLARVVGEAVAEAIVRANL